MAVILLVVVTCGPSVHAAGNLALEVSVDRTAAAPGDNVTFTVTLTGGRDSHIDGIGFHVQVTDGLTVESVSVDCASKFQMSSFSKASGLFSAAAARNGTGLDDDTWQILTVTCSVAQTAAGTQKLFISETVDGAADPKWSLFWLDDDNDAHDLDCDLSEASAEVTIDPAGKGTMPAEEAPADEDTSIPNDPSVPDERPSENEQSSSDRDQPSTGENGGKAVGNREPEAATPDGDRQTAEEPQQTQNGTRPAVGGDAEDGNEESWEEAVNGSPAPGGKGDGSIVKEDETPTNGNAENQKKQDGEKDGPAPDEVREQLPLPRYGGRECIMLAAGTALAIIILASVIIGIVRKRKGKNG